VPFGVWSQNAKGHTALAKILCFSECFEAWTIGKDQDQNLELYISDISLLRAYSGLERSNNFPPDSDGVDYKPPTHMVIFVQPIVDSNETFLVDVRFGGPSLAQPILLSNAKTNVVLRAAPPAGHRLTRVSHPSSSLGKTPCSSFVSLNSFQVE
jgi:hypothetical protein